MAKAVIEFNLSEPYDLMDYNRVNKSLDMALALWEIVYNIKKRVMWEIEKDNLDGYDTLERVYKEIWEEISKKNINIDDLIN